ncbi:MAG: aminoglycoside phosphotransferase family protein [Cytophagales bacterium]|jgi:aminoglycoside phosphotransferase (APT) family kinase protein|nr:aminoglycoside phosphotransferase family protein [Cytophagales bacterium]
MEAAEIIVTEDIARQLIKSQFPQWKNLPVRQIDNFGSDNTLYRLGDDWLIRLPRHQAAEQQLLKEHFWLKKMAPFLSVSVPMPVSAGKPSEEYPFQWSVYRWIEGDIYKADRFKDSDEAVWSIVRFLSELQKIDTTNAPQPGEENNFRGVPLAVRDAQTRIAIKDLADVYDGNLLTEIWDFALKTPAWNRKPVWIHGDLHWGNILTNEDQIVGVIDFGCLGVGDPATDVMAAWVLFSPEARKEFKQALNVDNDTWVRGMGWALSWAAIALPYYLPKKHLLADIATFTMNNILADYRQNSRFF